MFEIDKVYCSCDYKELSELKDDKMYFSLAGVIYHFDKEKETTPAFNITKTEPKYLDWAELILETYCNDD